ncbi:MAG: ketose 1,6-bisphosphate aldolase [Candidatus Sumerlaeia bacterium]
MPLVTLKDALQDACARRYAVGSFNVVNLDFLEAILEAAEAEYSPVILSVAEVHFKYVTLENISPAILACAQRARVPVVVHLDHGESLEAIMRALRNGFTSIMFDGSHLPYEENVARTAQVAAICHALGVSVEAELGCIGGEEGGQGGQANRDLFTDPRQAQDFCRRTGCDALAVAIGTVHGLYKAAPNLDLERLEQIRQLVPVPLVLHGGTGLSDDDFHNCIDRGVAKINFFTGMSVGATAAVRERLAADPKFSSYPDLLALGKKTITQIVREQMRIFRSSGVCRERIEACGIAQVCAAPGRAAIPAAAPEQPAALTGTGGQPAGDPAALAEIIAQSIAAVLNRSNS